MHNAPSLTIEASWNRPVRVKWINELMDANGHYLPHLLPVDQTLHWANPPGGVDGRDTRPTFNETPGPYTGPVPIVTRVHGAVGVGDDSHGSLFYPNTREFFDDATGENPGYIPFTDLSPIWNPEFFGNCIMVNGNTWPFLDVEQRRYRFRFLNGCQSRFLILDFSNIPGVEVWQIANEGGFLAAPVNITAGNGNRLLMALAERADMIVDFTNVPQGNYVLGNAGPDEPFGGGEPPDDFDTADPDTTGQVMQFRVGPALTADLTTPPQFLSLPPSGRCPLGDTRGLWRSWSRHRSSGTVPRRRCWAPSTTMGPRRQRCGRSPSAKIPASTTPKCGSSTTSPPTLTRCTSTR